MEKRQTPENVALQENAFNESTFEAEAMFVFCVLSSAYQNRVLTVASMQYL